MMSLLTSSIRADIRTLLIGKQSYKPTLGLTNDELKKQMSFRPVQILMDGPLPRPSVLQS